MSRSLKRYCLKNNNNMQVELCDFGARILSIKVPDTNGNLVEMTLNHERDEDILNDEFYMGTTVGRVCNRIANAEFELEGKRYTLPKNDGENTLHGGPNGFDKFFWRTAGLNAKCDTVKFEIVSSDGDQGFPGEVNVSVRYQLSDKNELIITYHASADQATPVNLCNHAYFSLGERHVRNMAIQINANHYLPVNESSIPLGKFESVTNTRFDLNELTKLEDVLTHEGYDHCYKTNQSLVAIVKGQTSKFQLEVETDHLGVQFYTGNYLPNRQTAFCLEAQGFPDAINQKNIPCDIVRPKDDYNRRVIYRFSKQAD